MTRPTAADIPRLLRELSEAFDPRPPVQACSFCGLTRAESNKLIAGPEERVFICDKCIRVSMSILGIGPPDPVLSPEDLAEKRLVRSDDIGRHGGLVYAVATVPEIDHRRIKVGYTTRPIEKRLEAFRTVNPTAILLGLWSAPSDGEFFAHQVVEGRVRDTEVFHVPDVLAALAAIDKELTERWP